MRTDGGTPVVASDLIAKVESTVVVKVTSKIHQHPPQKPSKASQMPNTTIDIQVHRYVDIQTYRYIGIQKST